MVNQSGFSSTHLGVILIPVLLGAWIFMQGEPAPSLALGASDPVSAANYAAANIGIAANQAAAALQAAPVAVGDDWLTELLSGGPSSDSLANNLQAVNAAVGGKPEVVTPDGNVPQPVQLVQPLEYSREIDGKGGLFVGSAQLGWMKCEWIREGYYIGPAEHLAWVDKYRPYIKSSVALCAQLGW